MLDFLSFHRMIERLVVIEGVNVHQTEVAQMNAELEQNFEDHLPWIFNIHTALCRA